MNLDGRLRFRLVGSEDLDVAGGSNNHHFTNQTFLVQVYFSFWINFL